MAEKIYKGKNLRIFVDGESILHSTECGFSTTRNFEDIATKDTQGNVSTPGNYEWSLTSNSLFADKDIANTTQTDFVEVLQKFKDGTRVFVQFTTKAFGDAVISGYCYVNGVNVTASTEGSATGDFGFKGDQDFDIDRIPASGPLPVISSANVIEIENGTAGTFNVVASETPTNYSFVGVTPPAGVTINATTGVISFTDAVAVGNYLGTVIRVTNANGYTDQLVGFLVTEA
jgi:hypothetical protein